ncbi:hypothetical protein PHSY_007299 [Pseudozyma hubeiensis SY62]|uniref:Thioredoxin domain-containing protein n=1 Tax=Pseudozyma hubeiensis (strain SY62) TaxID=1305764 RepID=R9PEB5_PSEHS|nr:hypothetical protein PHSY_007299 [Pseudozyma hubeiensis SY62]GAC99696.1 hypothetical protein PHSY_007299 [Pseudozyma hubeiensis SY62]
MTVSYTHSPSFSAHNSASPPQSPVTPSSAFGPSSRASGPSSPRAPSRALGAAVSASPFAVSDLVESSTDSATIVVPNDCMEAGFGLRRSPLIPSEEILHGSRTSQTASHISLIDDPESSDARYEPAFTGDIDLHERFVYRRPYVDRAVSRSKRRSQLILEQKYQQQRPGLSSAASTNEQELVLSALTTTYSPRASRSRRPGTAPHRVSVSPLTPESASGRLSSVSSRSNVSSPGGLRELATGAAAQPASKRASWIRQTNRSETLSDSHHYLSTAGLLEAAVPASAAEKASRRHSSFLTGDYRSASPMPILASNSFDVPSQHNGTARSKLSPSPRLGASSNSLGAAPNKRTSMLSTDSSATSSSKEGRTSGENVEFEGDDAKHQAHSSASSGCGHDDSPASKLATTSQRNGTDVFTTPRSSSEHDKSGESTSDAPTEKDKLTTTQQASESSHIPFESQATPLGHVEKSTDAPSTDTSLVPAPAITPAMLKQAEATVVPHTPLQGRNAVSPTVSPSKSFRPLPSSEESARGPSSGRSQASSDAQSGSSLGSPFGTLTIPSNARANANGRRGSGTSRRDSTTSIASANSSTSTYRIRRKAVPSDVDASERRESIASVNYSSAVESSPQLSPANSMVPLPSTREDGIQTIHAARSQNGSDFMRMARDATQAHMLANRRSGDPAVETNASSTGSATRQSESDIGLQPKASASARDLSSSGDLGVGAPPSTSTGVAGPSATRTPSRATIKRPTTAPVASSGQFRSVSGAQKGVLEVEGQQFVLGKDDAKISKLAQDLSPSIPNSVRFMQHQRNGSSRVASVGSAKRESNLVDPPISNGIVKAARSDDTSQKVSSRQKGDASATVAPSASGGWGLEQEIKIVDRLRSANGDVDNKAHKPRSASMDKSRKTLDSSDKANANKPLLNVIDEDESDEVKAAAREAGIPEGSYAIHPPSMLQLFESSQCLVYNQEGEEVLFGDLFKKRRTLVCFLRHWWCGFCQQFAMSVRNIDPLPLKRAGLDFIIVGQGDWHVIKAYREVMQVQYPMFADPKRNVYRALGMTLRTNDANPVCARPDYASMSMTKGILVAIKKGLFDMPIRNPGDMKLLGGDFILGPGLQCSFTHRMTTADGHMDIPRILAQAGCDLSLKTPKPMFTLDEKEARSAMLAGGNQNRRQARSIGRSRGKKSGVNDIATMDSSFGSATDSAAAGSMTAVNSSSRFARPSLWGRFPGRYSKSQVSLPKSESMADVSNDYSTARSFAAGPRSASAMRKISYDDRVRDSIDTQQTDLQFESRATSFDTRGGRPSDVSSRGGLNSLYKAQSTSELRKKFEIGGLGAFGSFRSKPRKSASAARMSLESHLAVPSGDKSRLSHSASNTSLGIANAKDANGAITPTQSTLNVSEATTATGDQVKALPIARGNASAARSNAVVAPATAAIAEPAAARAATGLGIDAAGDQATESAIRAAKGSDDPPTPIEKDSPVGKNLSAPGSFLMDLDVYDSLSRHPETQQEESRPNRENGKLGVSIFDAGLSPSQFSDSGFTQEAADAESDTEPSMSATQSPARSQRTAPSSTSASPAPAAVGPSTSSSFYSFNTFRAKPLEHLVEETDEDADDSRDQLENSEGSEDDEDEENDEPILFE